MGTYNIFKSRTFWSILAMFVIGGLNAVSGFLPAPLQTGLMAVLGIAATYFHLDTAARSDARN